jgi:1,4-alpha-glucan branching enzyme
MSFSSISFESANRYLNDVALPNQRHIPDEVEKLKARVAELNPADRNAATLSSHRRSVLQREIAKLFAAIDKKLQPVVVVPKSQTILKQCEALRDFAAKLPLSNYEELRKELKKLHPDLREKIYFAIWLVHGAPREDDFSPEKLKADPDVLVRSFPAFFAPTGGNLLKQIGDELAMAQKREELSEQIKELQERGSSQATAKQAELDNLTLAYNTHKEAIFRAHFADHKINHQQMKQLFKLMPKEVADKLPKPPYFGRGIDVELYKTLGAHYDRNSGKTTFRVYAPNAREITLNLSAWKRVEHTIRMTKKENGVWEAETEHAQPGRTYHFMIVGKHGGSAFKKVDPFAFGNYIHCREVGRDDHESVVREIDKEYAWTDGAWMAARPQFNPAKAPMSIYEVHLPTWKRKDNGDPYNWREMAPMLANYVKEMGYTHVELMALLEHTQLVSQGYQITNFFSINSNMGTFEDFQYFVNYLHEQKIGVIADWVPAHFAIDAFALCTFDGTPLLEDDDPNIAMHPKWGTFMFDFKKKFTKDFLGSNLDFLLRKFHIDCVRVDAVQTMMKLNVDRPPNQIRTNFRGHDVDLDAKAFLRNLNTIMRKMYPGVLMIAEDAEGWPNLTRPANERGVHFKSWGIGFHMTWHMGWMSDSLKYFSAPPQDRSSKYPLFAFTVKDVDGNEDIRPRGVGVIGLSHDENVHGKLTIFSKMGGNNFPEKFANGRLYLAHQLLRGGGPILDFQGNETAQTEEWLGRVIRSLESPDLNERKTTSMQWEEMNPQVDVNYHQYHTGARESRKALLKLYNRSPGLWDQTDAGFSWIKAEDSQNCVLSFHRRGGGQQFACIFNASGNDVQDYILNLPAANYAPELDKLVGVKEVYNTDDVAFAGQGRTNPHVEIIRDWTNRPTALKLRLPPYTAIVLEEQFS